MRAHYPWALALIVGLLLGQTVMGQAPGQVPSNDAGVALPDEGEAPTGHEPTLHSALNPSEGIAVGSTAALTITADVPDGDDVTLLEQAFPPLELLDKSRSRSVGKDGNVTFTFTLTLLAFEAGETRLDGVRLRVVTKEGVVFERTAPAVTLKVASLIANEPNAQLKPDSKPVEVMEDDLTLVYLLGGLLFALAVAAGTLWLQRYMAARNQEPLPPPPPRPPWEIAVEKLSELRRRKQDMVAAGEAVEFVDRVSDIVREYLGRCFGFTGLDTTTEELLERLRQGLAPVGLQEESRDYLRRCDLVKFAKVDPDQDEVDLIFAKAQDIVQFSMPHHGAASGDEPQGGQP